MGILSNQRINQPVKFGFKKSVLKLRNSD